MNGLKAMNLTALLKRARSLAVACQCTTQLRSSTGSRHFAGSKILGRAGAELVVDGKGGRGMTGQLCQSGKLLT